LCDSCNGTQNIQFIKDFRLSLAHWLQSLASDRMNSCFWLWWLPPFRQKKGERMGHGIGTRSNGHRPGLCSLAVLARASIHLRYIPFMDEKRELLRHTLATLAYRTTRAIEDAPESFADFSGTGRRPVEILAHTGDLLQWALNLAKGVNRWETHLPFPWRAEQNHFYALLGAFDQFLASDKPIQAPIERLFQGPIADALTHAGQLAMLRRLAGAPICGENYYVAAIAVGQVGAAQPASVQPFK